MYENLNLTTLVVRDKLGHGMYLIVLHLFWWIKGIPVAWMLASSGTQYFLKLHRLRCPLVIPRYMISDFDCAQLKNMSQIILQRQQRTIILPLPTNL
jgi:hypothetical protein